MWLTTANDKDDWWRWPMMTMITTTTMAVMMATAMMKVTMTTNTTIAAATAWVTQQSTNKDDDNNNDSNKNIIIIITITTNAFISSLFYSIAFSILHCTLLHWNVCRFYVVVLHTQLFVCTLYDLWYHSNQITVFFFHPLSYDPQEELSHSLLKKVKVKTVNTRKE